MPHTREHFATGTTNPNAPIPILPSEIEGQDFSVDTGREDCERLGGTWDAAARICRGAESRPPFDPAPFTPEIIRAGKGERNEGRITGTTLPDGSTFFGNEAEIRDLVGKRVQQLTDPSGSQPAGTTRTNIEIGREQSLLQSQGAQLAQQVGQISPSTGITPTNLSQTDAITAGVMNSIPRALGLAAGYAAIGGAAGLATGPAAPVVSPALAIAGATAGLVQGIGGGMISNMRGQRTDNTNAQQRVLDEGKQTLKDWSTLAKADPANREFYLSQFNVQLQLIQDAHVQMLTDTNADVAKFESAVPNLAEFNSFYSAGGERDALVEDMRISLTTPVSIEYAMVELTTRRANDI